MNFIQTLFFLQFLAVVGFLVVKLYNVFSVGKFYDIKMAFLFLILTTIAYAVGMYCIMMDTSVLYLSVLFNLENWLYGLNFILFFAELAFLMKDIAVKPVEAYNAKNAVIKEKEVE